MRLGQNCGYSIVLQYKNIATCILKIKQEKKEKYYFEKLNKINGILQFEKKLKLWNHLNYKTYFFDNLR
jgi:hypothetical protein